MNRRTLFLSDTETSRSVASAPDVEVSDDPSLTESLRVTARLQLGYLRIAQLYAGGVSKHVVESRVRDGWWRRPTRGVIDLAVDPPDTFRVGVRKVREAVLALMGYGPEAIAVGFTALTLHGVWGVPLSRTPQVSLPRASQRASRDGLVCRRFEKDVVPPKRTVDAAEPHTRRGRDVRSPDGVRNAERGAGPKPSPAFAVKLAQLTHR